MRTLLAALALAASVMVACNDKDDRGDSSVTERTATPTAASPSATSDATSSPQPAARAEGPAEHVGERARAHIEALAVDIGPRVAGTTAEARAAEYIRQTLASYGYDVEIMEFEFDGDRFRPAKVTVEGGAIDGFTMAGSGVVRASGAAVFVGLADSQGIGGRDLTGKLAVADRGVLRFGQKFENVRAQGAVGLVVINNQPGPISGSLGSDADIPVVGVSLEDGPRLKEAANRGSTVSVEPASSDQGKGLNVIARPSKGATCDILVGGHHDSVVGAPGANDNASGTANVLELARALAADGLDKGLCFATFGAEESGLFGSQALADEWQAAKRLPRYMLNLDVTAIGGEVEVIGSPEVREQALEVAQRLGIPASPSSVPLGTSSDHASFSRLGVQVLYFTSGGFDTIHTPLDVAADTDTAELDRVGDVAYGTIQALLARVAAG